MHLSLAVGFALLIGLMLAISWLRRASPGVRANTLKQVVIVGIIGLLLLLVVTGRLPWIFALAGILIPLLQRLLAASRIYKAARGPTPGQNSDVETRFIRMSLNHDSGEMNGEVLHGRFRGRTLDGLSIEELLELLRECRAEDDQSASVLEAYLDRMRGDDWRDQGEKPGNRTTTAATVTREEAYEVLGLKPGASKEEIIEAHRHLMQKLHPDRGGTTYLAAKINQAKDLLLGD